MVTTHAERHCAVPGRAGDAPAFLAVAALWGWICCIGDCIPFVDEALLPFSRSSSRAGMPAVSRRCGDALGNDAAWAPLSSLMPGRLMHDRRVVAPLWRLPVVAVTLSLQAGRPCRARTAMVMSQSDIASEVGWQVIKSGGNAVDAAVATAFALAVTHPTAGNIGGGGFLVFRAASGQATSFDFRETAPAGATAEMWLKDGKYDFDLHHNSHRSVGVPGTVAGPAPGLEENSAPSRGRTWSRPRSSWPATGSR